MEGKVLTIPKYTPGSVSLTDFSLVKGNTKPKGLVSELQSSSPSLPSTPCSSSELPCQHSLSPKMKQTQEETFRKQTCQGYLLHVLNNHHMQILSTYVRCSHLNFTLSSGWLREVSFHGGSVSQLRLHSGGWWTGDITHDAKGAVTTQGRLPLSKLFAMGKVPENACLGPWRPALWSHTACLLLSSWTMLETSSCMCTADEQGHQDGLPVWRALACRPPEPSSGWTCPQWLASTDAFTSPFNWEVWVPPGPTLQMEGLML